MSFQSIFSTELDLLEDSLLKDSDEEEEEFKKGVLLVCVLAEEYLSAKKARKAMYVREELSGRSTFNSWLKKDQKPF